MAVSLLRKLELPGAYAHDRKLDVVHGKVEGYNVLVRMENQAQYVLEMGLGLTDAQRLDLSMFLEQLKDEQKLIKSTALEGADLRVYFKPKRKANEAIREVVERLSTYLQAAGIKNACQYCGEEKDTHAYNTFDSVQSMCEECFALKQQQAQTQAEKQRGGNVGFGIIGALVGSLVGVLLWVVLGQIGFIAGIAGALIFLGAVKGYEILGRGISKVGIITCVLVSIVMIFVAENISMMTAIYFELSNYYIGLTPMDLDYGILFKEIWSDSEIAMPMIFTLLMGYALFAAATVQTIRMKYKSLDAHRYMGQLEATY